LQLAEQIQPNRSRQGHAGHIVGFVFDYDILEGDAFEVEAEFAIQGATPEIAIQGMGNTFSRLAMI